MLRSKRSFWDLKPVVAAWRVEDGALFQTFLLGFETENPSRALEAGIYRRRMIACPRASPKCPGVVAGDVEVNPGVVL